MNNMNSTTYEKKRAPTAIEIASARVRALGLDPAQVPKPAPIPAPTTQTRADFYARKNGGGYRTARLEHNCQQFGCFGLIREGERYFDTKETTTWPATKKLCPACAETAV